MNVFQMTSVTAAILQTKITIEEHIVIQREFMTYMMIRHQG